MTLVRLEPERAVKVLVPSVRTAPTGISEMMVRSVSLPSVSGVETEMGEIAIALSSSPITGLLATITGVSATGTTSTVTATGVADSAPASSSATTVKASRPLPLTCVSGSQ